MGRGVRICVFACALAAGAALASNALAASLVTGFLDPEQSATQNPNLMVSPAVAYSRVQEGGGNMVRLLLYWKRVATGVPTDATAPDDTAYNWAQIDQQVRDADAAGLKVLLVFRSAPMWAQGPAHANSEGSFKPDPAKLAQFAEAAATRYNGNFDPGPGGVLPAVRLWEIWNEPNLRNFLQPQFDSHHRAYSPGLYRRLLNAAAPALHAVNGSNIVVAGNTAPFGNTGNIKPLGFLRRLLCMTGRLAPKSACNLTVQADVFSHHPYTNGDPTHQAVDPDNISLGDLPDWKRLINAAVKVGHVRRSDGTRKQSVGLWATELGWDTKPPDPIGVPTKLHARWTAEALYRVWKVGLSVAIWTQYRDYPLTSDPVFGAYQAGLYYYDGDNDDTNDTPKLSLQAFRFPFVAYASNGRISAWGRTPNGLPGTVRIERRSSTGQWVPKKTLPANASGIFSTSWASSDKKGSYRAIRVGDPDPARRSVPFSLVRPPDRFVIPFGCGGASDCP
jgi:hypothetical protein